MCARCGTQSQDVRKDVDDEDAALSMGLVGRGARSRRVRDPARARLGADGRVIQRGGSSEDRGRRRAGEARGGRRHRRARARVRGGPASHRRSGVRDARARPRRGPDDPGDRRERLARVRRRLRHPRKGLRRSGDVRQPGEAIREAGWTRAHVDQRRTGRDGDDDREGAGGVFDDSERRSRRRRRRRRRRRERGLRPTESSPSSSEDDDDDKDEDDRETQTTTKRPARPNRSRDVEATPGKPLTLRRLVSRHLPRRLPLAVAYLACVLRRQPLHPADFTRWALEGDVPYVARAADVAKDLRALGADPEPWPNALTAPRAAPLPDKIAACAHDVASTLNVELPPCNALGLCARFASELGLHGDVADAAVRLLAAHESDGLRAHGSRTRGFVLRGTTRSRLSGGAAPRSRHGVRGGGD